MAQNNSDSNFTLPKIEPLVILLVESHCETVEDLKVVFMGAEDLCDTHYFTLCRESPPAAVVRARAKEVLTMLLQQWRQYVLKASEQDVLFLPYEFADHYMRCFRCTVKGNECQIYRGWTSDHAGYGVDAKDISSFVRSVKTFEPEPPEPWNTTREEFATTIDRIIASW